MRLANQVRDAASAGPRAAVLSVNFFLIILAYYQIKPASRSLFIEHLGADQLPYVWIGTALLLGSLIGFYHQIVARYSRFRVVMATCVVSIVALMVFAPALETGEAATAAMFYIFVDIFGVVLVEQFWSLTNTVFNTREGKTWFGLVAVGGLFGGVVGGLLATFLLEKMSMSTTDLLFVAVAFLALITIINMVMQRSRILDELSIPRTAAVDGESLVALLRDRYVILIAAILLLAQLAQPLVEFQFIKTVEYSFPILDERTSYLASFFALLGAVSIMVNLIITPLIHRYLGVIAGMTVQPLVLGIASMFFMWSPTMVAGAIMKISDRGLSYSINRASKEQLYIPMEPVSTYQAKAWIDMLGYRLFKVVGSVIILAMTQWSLVPSSIVSISWVTLACCLVWLYAVFAISGRYYSFIAQPSPATDAVGSGQENNG